MSALSREVDYAVSRIEIETMFMPTLGIVRKGLRFYVCNVEGEETFRVYT
jgi:hypothetical protein